MSGGWSACADAARRPLGAAIASQSQQAEVVLKSRERSSRATLVTPVKMQRESNRAS